MIIDIIIMISSSSSTTTTITTITMCLLASGKARRSSGRPRSCATAEAGASWQPPTMISYHIIPYHMMYRSGWSKLI